MKRRGSQKQTNKPFNGIPLLPRLFLSGLGLLNNDLFSFKSVYPFMLASQGVIPLAGFLLTGRLVKLVYTLGSGPSADGWRVRLPHLPELSF